MTACGGVQDSTSPVGATSDFEEVCTGGDFIGPKRTAFPDAAAYEGTGNPLVVVEHAGIDHPSSVTSWYRLSSSDLERIEDPKQVQLVACAEHGDDHESVGTCTFDAGETAKVLRSSAKVTIFEARSAEKVAEVTVDAAEYTCPSILSFKGEPTVYTSPTVDEYRAALTEAVPGIEIVG
ncbi:hypothetical protein [Nocardia sp. CA-290969]|uniref:hypothetical protein n=1 Tax=Nocardia sp. CA-290969 TaxID=3239986 RepID=UPI003D8C628D